MRKLAKVGFFILFVLLILFFGLLYYINYSIVRTFDNQKEYKFDIGKDSYHKISFTQANVIVEPFKFRAKLAGVKEEFKEGVILHQQPLFAHYDIFSRELKFSYEGGSTFQSSEGLQNLNIQGRYEFVLVIEPLDLLYGIKNNGHISLSDVKEMRYNINDANCKIANEDKIVYSNNDISISLKPEDRSVNGFPRTYLAKFSAKSFFDKESQVLPPLSFIYAAFIPFNLDVSSNFKLQTKADHFSSEEIFKYFVLNMDSEYLWRGFKNKGIVDLTFEFIDKQNMKGSIIVDFADNCEGNCLEKFSELFTQDEPPIFEYISPNSTLRQIAPQEKELIVNLLKILHKNDPNILSSSHIKADAVFSIENGKLDMKIGDLALWLGNSGIKTDGKFEKDNNSGTFKIDGQVSVFDNNDLISSISEFWATLSPILKSKGMTEDEIKSVFQRIFTSYLLSISDYPDSTNKNETIIGIKIDSTKPESEWKIGLLNPKTIFSVFALKYYASFFEYCQKFSDPVAKLKEILPDIVQHPELLKIIVKAQEAEKEAQRTIHNDSKEQAKQGQTSK